MNNDMAELIAKAIHFYKKYRFIINIVGFSVVSLTLINGILKLFFIDSIIFLFLGYRTVKTLKYEGNNSDSLTNVLKLWGFYSSLSVCEIFFKYIIALTSLGPFYNLSKFLLYSWLMKNKENIDFYYDSTVMVVYNKYEAHISYAMDTLENIIKISLSILFDYVNSEKDTIIKSITKNMNEDTIKKINNKLNQLEYEDKKD